MTPVERMLMLVERFNKEIIGLPIPARPERLDPTRKMWSHTALMEEVEEFASADSLEGEADALIDLTYYALGRLVEMGLAPLPLFEEVHSANMRKRRGALSKRPGSLGYDAAKPDDWTPPNLQPYLCVDWQEAFALWNTHRKTELDPPTVAEMNRRAKAALEAKRGCYPGDWKDKAPPHKDSAAARPRTEKDTAGKPPVSRVPAVAEVQEALVFGFGSTKYSWDGYKATPPTYHDVLSAIKRHVGRFADGEDLDPESGLSHVAHARCNTAILLWMIANRPDKDNRNGKEAA